jgi:hypothetical protein
MAGVVGVIWVWREADYFCGRGWTGQISLKLLAKIADWRNAIGYRFRSSGLRFLAATSHLVVAAGAGRRAAELRIASATQRGRTIRVSVRISVVRMQDDDWSSIPVHGIASD